MCGINGIYKFTSIDEKDIEKVKNMAFDMEYRGPDDKGFFHNDKIALSQVRLSIIGVLNGKQPIFNEDKSLLIICNGEIYNYKELREKLKQKGHIFTTESDTEVILHLYEEKQEKCLDDLRGMFAIAIYSIKDKKLFIAKDICGKKPLYYAQTPLGFIFSSEITPIQKYWLKKFDVDVEQIKTYLKYSYSQSMDETYIRQIKKLEAAQYAIIDNDGVSLKRYWKKKNIYSFEGSYEDARQKTLELLRESVTLRLRSDVSVAILLSGGIDSSAIVSLASQTHNNIHAITVGYKGVPECDERALAKRLAEEKGVIWHEIELDENDYVKYFDEYVKYLDEPVADLASIAQWGIYKKAKELGFTVLLSGNGGDELFYGYPMHNLVAENIKTLREFSELKRKPSRFIKYFLKNRKRMFELMKTYDRSSYKVFYHNYYDNFKYKFDDDFTFDQVNFREKYYNDEKEEIDKVYSYLFNVWLPNNCYYLADKLAMGNSIEVRTPFADKNLIEFVSTLPLDYKYHLGKAKGFLKDVLKDIVPDYILKAQKRGFTPPNNVINQIIKTYKSKYFKTEMTGYPEVLTDKFLWENQEKIKI